MQSLLYIDIVLAPFNGWWHLSQCVCVKKVSTFSSPYVLSVTTSQISAENERPCPYQQFVAGLNNQSPSSSKASISGDLGEIRRVPLNALKPSTVIIVSVPFLCCFCSFAVAIYYHKNGKRSREFTENFLKIGRKRTQTFCYFSVQNDKKRKGAAFQPLPLVFVLFFGFVVEGFLCPFGELAVCFFGGFCKVEG